VPDFKNFFELSESAVSRLPPATPLLKSAANDILLNRTNKILISKIRHIPDIDFSKKGRSDHEKRILSNTRSVRLNTQLADAIDAFADHHQLNVSDLIRIAIIDYIDYRRLAVRKVERQ
jgi:hypothetical protein